MALKRITPGLKDTTLVTKIDREYKDLDLSFASKPGTKFEDGTTRGDVYRKVDVRSVEQSMKNILLTNWYEKPFQPFFGANLRQLLFELDTMVSEPEVNELIRSAIERWEPRVEVQDIELNDPGAAQVVPKGINNVFYYSSSSDSRNHTLIITVHARILNTGQEISTSVSMNRIR